MEPLSPTFNVTARPSTRNKTASGRRRKRSKRNQQKSKDVKLSKSKRPSSSASSSSKRKGSRSHSRNKGKKSLDDDSDLPEALSLQTSTTTLDSKQAKDVDNSPTIQAQSIPSTPQQEDNKDNTVDSNASKRAKCELPSLPSTARSSPTDTSRQNTPMAVMPVQAKMRCGRSPTIPTIIAPHVARTTTTNPIDSTNTTIGTNNLPQAEAAQWATPSKSSATNNNNGDDNNSVGTTMSRQNHAATTHEASVAINHNHGDDVDHNDEDNDDDDDDSIVYGSSQCTPPLFSQSQIPPPMTRSSSRKRSKHISRAPSEDMTRRTALSDGYDCDQGSYNDNDNDNPAVPVEKEKEKEDEDEGEAGSGDEEEKIDDTNDHTTTIVEEKGSPPSPLLVRVISQPNSISSSSQDAAQLVPDEMHTLHPSHATASQPQQTLQRQQPHSSTGRISGAVSCVGVLSHPFTCKRVTMLTARDGAVVVCVWAETTLAMWKYTAFTDGDSDGDGDGEPHKSKKSKMMPVCETEDMSTNSDGAVAGEAFVLLHSTELPEEGVDDIVVLNENHVIFVRQGTYPRIHDLSLNKSLWCPLSCIGDVSLSHDNTPQQDDHILGSGWSLLVSRVDDERFCVVAHNNMTGTMTGEIIAYDGKSQQLSVKTTLSQRISADPCASITVTSCNRSSDGNYSHVVATRGADSFVWSAVSGESLGRISWRGVVGSHVDCVGVMDKVKGLYSDGEDTLHALLELNEEEDSMVLAQVVSGSEHGDVDGEDNTIEPCDGPTLIAVELCLDADRSTWRCSSKSMLITPSTNSKCAYFQDVTLQHGHIYILFPNNEVVIIDKEQVAPLAHFNCSRSTAVGDDDNDGGTNKSSSDGDGDDFTSIVGCSNFIGLVSGAKVLVIRG